MLVMIKSFHESYTPFLGKKLDHNCKVEAFCCGTLLQNRNMYELSALTKRKIYSPFYQLFKEYPVSFVANFESFIHYHTIYELRLVYYADKTLIITLSQKDTVGMYVQSLWLIVMNIYRSFLNFRSSKVK